MEHHKLAPYVGWRVEITYDAHMDCYTDPITFKRRAIVGRSMGPCKVSLLMHNRRSTGGEAVSTQSDHIVSVRPLYKVR